MQAAEAEAQIRLVVMRGQLQYFEDKCQEAEQREEQAHLRAQELEMMHKSATACLAENWAVAEGLSGELMDKCGWPGGSRRKA